MNIFPDKIIGRDYNWRVYKIYFQLYIRKSSALTVILTAAFTHQLAK